MRKQDILQCLKLGILFLKTLEIGEKVIKNPDLDAIDWKSMAEKDNAFLKELRVDRNETLVLSAVSDQFFQDLMAYMGFTEGLYLQ